MGDEHRVDELPADDRGTLVSGAEVNMWVRATLGCRHDGERWRIVHDHESVPFDAETGLALTDLRPLDQPRTP